MRPRLQELCLSAFGVGLVVLMGAIVVQVICSALDINPLLTTEDRHFLIGDAITLNSLLDFQWHLLVVCGLLPAGLVWLMDRHVRVDFLYQGLSERKTVGINLIGHVLFALPFFALVLPASWKFALRSWSSGEGSANGGLNNLWLVKSVLPLGLALLALAIAFETYRLVRRLR